MRDLPPPRDACDVFPGSQEILRQVIEEAEKNNIHTFQKRNSNLIQICSLMNIVCGLVEEVTSADIGGSPAVLDIGGNKYYKYYSCFRFS